MDAGLQLTETEVMVFAGADTVTVAVPNFVVSCTDFADTVAVPAPDGVNTPPDVMLPPVADQVTAVL